MKTKDAISLWGNISVTLLLFCNLLVVNTSDGLAGWPKVTLYYILVALTAASATFTIAKIRSLK